MVASIVFYGNAEAGMRDSIVITFTGNFPEGFKVKLKISRSYSSELKTESI